MTKREIYPTAPLRFVALELRFASFIPQLATTDGQAKVFERLREQFPIAQAVPTVELAVTPTGETTSPQPKTEFRLLNPERTRSITISGTSFGVNTSAFVDFPKFLETIKVGVEALGEFDIPGIARVGLRYTDEIRIPNATKPRDWIGYIDERLLTPLEFAPTCEAELIQGVLGFRVDSHRRVMMRYGYSEQPAVDPEGPLKVTPPPKGPMFLLDLDSFWLTHDEQVHRFEADEILALSEMLDASAHDFFEEAITEQLRNEVMRAEQKEVA